MIKRQKGKSAINTVIKLKLTIFIIFILSNPNTFAHRPFETEDASVVEQGTFELEIGFAIDEQKQKEGDEVSIKAPVITVTAGLFYDMEVSFDISGEFIDEEQESGFNSTTEQFADSAINIKKVWLHDHGFMPDIATQTSLIFPVEKRSRGIDFEHSFISTWDLKHLIFNASFGGGTEHIDENGKSKATKGRYFYGGILDFQVPHFKNLHLAAEYSAKKIVGESLEHQILSGIILDRPHGTRYDIAAFWGLNHESIDWGFTTGVTIGW